MSKTMGRETIYAESSYDWFGFLSVPGLIVIGKGVWKNRPEKWKWAYGQVELESQRIITDESEIVDSYWKFTVCTLSLCFLSFPTIT
jgi:hypothetical protein